MSPRTSKQFEEIRTERKRLIEEAALEVFAEDGYHSASVSKIAKKAGVSKGLMYNYFSSKEDLLKSSMRDVIQDIEKQFNFPKEKPLDNNDVINFINNSINLVVEDVQRWKLFSGIFFQKDVMALMHNEMMKGAETYMTSFLNYFKEKGSANPTVTMRYFHAVIDGVQMHVMFDVENFPAEEIKKMIIKQFVK